MITAPPERPARRAGVLRLSKDPEVRSIQVGVAATILIHLLILLVAPYLLRTGLTHPIKQDADKQLFNIELAPPDEPQPEPPKPANPFKFVETNPDAPDNPPDKTDNFAAQNQQVAQEKPTPNGKSDRPALEGEKDIQSTQIVDGHLTQPQLPPAPPAPETPPTPPTETAEATKRAQDPLPGFEKIDGEDKNGIGSNIAEVSAHPESVPEKVDGAKDAPDIVGATNKAFVVDPHKPQPRPQLLKNVRPAVFQENKIGTMNIGPVAVDAKWSNYGRYLQKMIDAIQARWDNLIAASKHYPQPGSRVTVTFVMNSDGKITTFRNTDGDAGDLATNWCVTAISPSPDFTYGEWTSDMTAVLGDHQELTFTFYYR